MTILYINYWKLNDGLTLASTFPSLRVLCEMEKVDKIVFTTIERSGDFENTVLEELGGKVIHKPLFPLNIGPNILNKITDFVRFPQQLKAIAEEENIDLIIARGAPSGALALKLKKALDIPFYVESFEPHAQYMLEAGAWKAWDPRYIFEQKWEAEQKQIADGIVTVANKYADALVKLGVEKRRVYTIPCVVDSNQFAFSDDSRRATRKELSIPDKAMVGAYVGKFGGLYLDDEAFTLFAQCFKRFKDFHLLLLTAESKESIAQRAQKHGISMDKIKICFVQHAEVPQYLSASDFAFSLMIPSPSKAFCSPIKNGEYWANGLPIVCAEGLGDDSEIIKQEGGGALFHPDDSESMDKALDAIQKMIAQKNYRDHQVALAKKHRSPEIIREVYEKLFG